MDRKLIFSGRKKKKKKKKNVNERLSSRGIESRVSASKLLVFQSRRPAISLSQNIGTPLYIFPGGVRLTRKSEKYALWALKYLPRYMRISLIAFDFSQWFPPTPSFTEDDLSPQEGKVFIVTGGNAGVGYELCKILYATGASIYMASRSKVIVTCFKLTVFPFGRAKLTIDKGKSRICD
jgi:hypothetical protein